MELDGRNAAKRQAVRSPRRVGEREDVQLDDLYPGAAWRERMPPSSLYQNQESSDDTICIRGAG